MTEVSVQHNQEMAMIAYRKYATVQKSKQIVLSDLPFQPGERVEVVIIADSEPLSDRVRELRELFEVTQFLPQAQAITEDDIAAEIAADRLTSAAV
jgi:hypothetical protein